MFNNNSYGVYTFDSRLDLGGDTMGSVGRNWLYCNTMYDMVVNPNLVGNNWLPDLYANNNTWGHKPPTVETSNFTVSADIYNDNSLTNVHLDNSYLVAPSLCTP
ncbi:DUF1565 domain-containing protein [Leptospira mayottensis]|uniref:DUF1565 domain-containing protein n=1 Tax=Leptospira mayottensis TaxID=1137606 RepID=UPI001F426B94|nr:DUF1565 domain-containing protein [Leptospira mayottensis]